MGNATKLPHDFMSQEYTAREEGYIFVYLSNENLTQVDLYFDDVVFTHTPGNLLQYNEYYPFGLQTANSWTRENTTGNNFLGNAGTEFNTTSQWYDLDFRNYDPALGRLHGVDPMAAKYSSLTPYNYSFNDPVSFSDPSGADPWDNGPYGGSAAYYYALNFGYASPGREAIMDPVTGGVAWNPATEGGYLPPGAVGNPNFSLSGFLSSTYLPNFRGHVRYTDLMGQDRAALPSMLAHVDRLSIHYGLPSVANQIWNPWAGEDLGDNTYSGGWVTNTAYMRSLIADRGYAIKTRTLLPTNQLQSQTLQTQNCPTCPNPPAPVSTTDLLLAGIGTAGLVAESQSAIIQGSRSGFTSGKLSMNSPRVYSKATAGKIKIAAKGVGWGLTIWSVADTEIQFDKGQINANRRVYNHINNGVGLVYPAVGLPMAAGDYLGKKYSTEIVNDVSQPGGFLFEGTKFVLEFLGIPTSPRR